jgi:hypothetical protein
VRHRRIVSILISALLLVLASIGAVVLKTQADINACASTHYCPPNYHGPNQSGWTGYAPLKHATHR